MGQTHAVAFYNGSREPLRIRRGNRIGHLEPFTTEGTRLVPPSMMAQAANALAIVNLAAEFDFDDFAAFIGHTNNNSHPEQAKPSSHARPNEKPGEVPRPPPEPGEEALPPDKQAKTSTYGDIFRDHIRSNAKLGIQRVKNLPEDATEEGVHHFRRSPRWNKRVKQLVAKYASRIFKDTEPIRVPPEQHLRVPLVEGWQNLKLGQRKYPCSEEDEKFLDKTLDELHEQGRFEWVHQPTPFGSPVFVAYRTVNGVRKARMVVDLRALNKATIPDAYPMPLQSDVIKKIRGKTCLSVVDARAFFHQFLVREEHRERFTIVSHRGQERSKVALMGFKNSPAYVQRFMDRALRPFQTFATAFVDDIVIFSDNEEDHLEHLEKIFDLFTWLNITLSPTKNFLEYPSVELLSFKVDGMGLTNTEGRVKAISVMEFLRTLQALEKWIGMTEFLRYLIPRYVLQDHACS